MNQPLPGEPLPAVLVGGPPHSGKSVLIYSLSQALRARGVEHYALRACPDGEGDWSNEAPAERVREIRFKGQWTPLWVERISRDIQRRHLPLLVDVGGRPTTEQARMFDHCTHAVLLTPDEPSRKAWQELVARYRLPVLADLTSSLEGENRLEATEPALRGALVNLQRGATATGEAFTALVSQIAALFTADGIDYRRRHLASAPAEIELVVDLERLARTLGWAKAGEKIHWLPEHVPALLDYLPAATPLAVYGRGPVWIYAALARLAWPARFASFDVRLGWSAASALPTVDRPPAFPVRWMVQPARDAVRIAATLPEHYIDISQLPEVAAPLAPAGAGVILDGRLPVWLYASLAQTYAAASWLAVHQPALGGHVVVHSQDRRYPVGQLLAQ